MRVYNRSRQNIRIVISSFIAIIMILSSFTPCYASEKMNSDHGDNSVQYLADAEIVNYIEHADEIIDLSENRNQLKYYYGTTQMGLPYTLVNNCGVFTLVVHHVREGWVSVNGRRYAIIKERVSQQEKTKIDLSNTEDIKSTNWKHLDDYEYHISVSDLAIAVGVALIPIKPGKKVLKAIIASLVSQFASGYFPEVYYLSEYITAYYRNLNTSLGTYDEKDVCVLYRSNKKTKPKQKKVRSWTSYCTVYQ